MEYNLKKKAIFVLATVLFVLTLSGQTKYKKDFDFFCKTIAENYAYFDINDADWGKVREVYQPYVDTCNSRNSFIHILEKTLNELSNGHNFLNTNTPESNRLIPSGSDLKIKYDKGKFFVEEIRPDFNADKCGMKKGMQILQFNDVPVEVAIAEFLPITVKNYQTSDYDYAVNMLLAGKHHAKRKIKVKFAEKEMEFSPDNIPNRAEQSFNSLVDAHLLDKEIGYIRVNNSLGDIELIKAFDNALDSLFDCKGLILDLRETASGGTSITARAIMGRFINSELPYQKHIYVGEEKETGIKRTTLELVSPRKKVFNKPLVILVSNWTGSMGEGIAIGFDALKRGSIVGTKMAGLLGEIFTFETEELKIPFSFPCVKLQTVNGIPREQYVPKVLVTDQSKSIEIAKGLIRKATNK